MYEPLTGWVQVFFPYLIIPGHGGFDQFAEAGGGVAKKQLQRNGGLANYCESQLAKVNVGNFSANTERGKGRRGGAPPAGTSGGIKLENFPPAISNAPFRYKDANTGKDYKMAFSGGLTCLIQHPDGAIEPKCGWAILDGGECPAAGHDATAATAKDSSDQRAPKLQRVVAQAQNPQAEAGFAAAQEANETLQLKIQKLKLEARGLVRTGNRPAAMEVLRNAKQLAAQLAIFEEELDDDDECSF